MAELAKAGLGAPSVDPPPLAHPVQHAQLVRLCQEIAAGIDEKHPLFPGPGSAWSEAMLAEPICSSDAWLEPDRVARRKHYALAWSLLELEHQISQCTPDETDDLLGNAGSPAAIKAAQPEWVVLLEMATEQYNARAGQERKERKERKRAAHAEVPENLSDEEGHHREVEPTSDAEASSPAQGHHERHPAFNVRARANSYSGPAHDLGPAHRLLPPYQQRVQEDYYARHQLPPPSYLQSLQTEEPSDWGSHGTGDRFFPDSRV
ncbi:hypothetical protein BMF94_0704 [Rhodotorula taiwanensis]|uniref:Uncharacterized protein n=1 Tax=Rhodotorula taiwanensis TaxID=741276 RepID=A0A2S5BIA8_9BASI|nr:hypothetical protein BMF94_0704 [Rhodotorula taiwanensis]